MSESVTILEGIDCPPNFNPQTLAGCAGAALELSGMMQELEAGGFEKSEVAELLGGMLEQAILEQAEREGLIEPGLSGKFKLSIGKNPFKSLNFKSLLKKNPFAKLGKKFGTKFSKARKALEKSVSSVAKAAGKTLTKVLDSAPDILDAASSMMNPGEAEADIAQESYSEAVQEELPPDEFEQEEIDEVTEDGLEGFLPALLPMLPSLLPMASNALKTVTGKARQLKATGSNLAQRANSLRQLVTPAKAQRGKNMDMQTLLRMVTNPTSVLNPAFPATAPVALAQNAYNMVTRPAARPAASPVAVPVRATPAAAASGAMEWKKYALIGASVLVVVIIIYLLMKNKKRGRK